MSNKLRWCCFLRMMHGVRFLSPCDFWFAHAKIGPWNWHVLFISRRGSYHEDPRVYTSLVTPSRPFLTRCKNSIALDETKCHRGISLKAPSQILGCNIILETLRPPLEFFILVYWKTTSINNALSISIYHLLPTIGTLLIEVVCQWTKIKNSKGGLSVSRIMLQPNIHMLRLHMCTGLRI